MSIDLTTTTEDLEQAGQILKVGGIGVLPTDTIYGIVGSALHRFTVEKIYTLRKRSPDKPLIVLINQVDDLKLFNISIDEKLKSFLEKIWPGKVSVVLPCTDDNFDYLHRGTKTLAFRLPNYAPLNQILSVTGPLVAPSANFEGSIPAPSIEHAKTYFTDQINFYLDAGKLVSPPSTLIKFVGEEIVVLRKGAVEITQEKL